MRKLPLVFAISIRKTSIHLAGQEQAEIDAARRLAEMVCWGMHNPFSDDPFELAEFLQDVRTVR